MSLALSLQDWIEGTSKITDKISSSLIHIEYPLRIILAYLLHNIISEKGHRPDLFVAKHMTNYAVTTTK